jgi:hypothetical protein
VTVTLPPIQPAPDWLVALLEKPTYEPPAQSPTTAAQRLARRLLDAELGIGSDEKFARAAIDRACAEVASKGPQSEERNHTLNRRAFDLYGLVKAGRLDRSQVDLRLTQAASSTGLGIKEIERTLASAWNGAEPKVGMPLQGRPEPAQRPMAPTTRLPAPGSQAATGADSEDPEPPKVFIYRSAAELVEAGDQPMEWALRGLLVNPTYGMIAGERKTLKSYVGTFLDLAIASGVPLFDKFTVDNPGPVVAYVGEGGEKPFGKRLGRIADAMGIARSDLADVPFRATTNVAPIASAKFLDSMEADLEGGLRLLHIDPYYAYHGATTNASNLFEEGQLLTLLSAPCMAAGTNLLINNHYNKTGTGQGLSRITQSGAQEWCDSWITLSHRNGETPNVETGEFHLALEIGSRQWGGIAWDLDLSIGRLDPDTGEFDGAITWDLNRAGSGPGAGQPGPGTVDLALRLVAECPGQYTVSSLGGRLGVRALEGREVVNRAITQGLVTLSPVTGEGGRTWERLFPGTSSGHHAPLIGDDVPVGTSRDIA